MASERASQQAFFGVSALLFAASAAVTIVWCASMSAMGEMPMPGGWTITVQALERVGVKTVLMTEEEDNEGGTAPPLLVPAPEVVAVVSTGTGGVDVTFPRVERVIGTREPEPHWYEERPAIHGRYGVSHLHDYYGAGRQGCVDF